MMGGRERKIWPPDPRRSSLGSPTVNNTPCLRAPSVPHTTDDDWPSRKCQMAISPVVASGDEKKKRFHGVAAVESSATAPSFVQACLGEGPPLGSSPGRAVGIPPVATSTSQGEKKRKRWERWKTNKNSTINRIRTLTIPSPFFLSR